MIRKTVTIMPFLMLALSVLVFASGTAESKSGAASKPYPNKPVTLVVPYKAGGGTDDVARILQAGLKKYLPVPVVVQDVGGGASVIGTRRVLNAKPDGYTMLINIVNIWTNKALKRVNFGPDDLAPVAETGTFYLVSATSSNSPYQNLKQLLAAAKEKPNTIPEATNIGAITYFTDLEIQDLCNCKLRLVQVGDGAQRIADVLGQQVASTIMGTNEVQPYYDSGKMRVLAVYSPKRVAGLPNAPTAVEQGINVIMPVDYWIFMPKATPKARIDYMANVFEKVMKDPEVVKAMTTRVMDPSFLKGEALKQHIDAIGKRIEAIAERHHLASTLSK